MHAELSLKETETSDVDVGKPEPRIVIVSPPNWFNSVLGDNELARRATVIGVVSPVSTGTIPSALTTSTEA